MKVKRLDHLVLTVADIDITCEFYSELLGMEVTEFGDGRKALHYGEQKINLHEKGKEFEPKAAKPTPGSADLCFITDLPLVQVIEQICDKGAKILEGPVEKTGASGAIRSIYLRDPDANLVEVSNYV